MQPTQQPTQQQQQPQGQQVVLKGRQEGGNDPLYLHFEKTLAFWMRYKAKMGDNKVPYKKEVGQVKSTLRRIDNAIIILKRNGINVKNFEKRYIEIYNIIKNNISQLKEKYSNELKIIK